MVVNTADDTRDITGDSATSADGVDSSGRGSTNGAGSSGDAASGDDPDIEPGVDADDDRPVLLFDGVCNLCNGYVQWVIEHDPDGEIRLGALQSEAGQRLLRRHGLPTGELESVVLVEGDDVHTKSTAVLRVLRRLGLPYSLTYPSVIVPKFVRDRAYDLVADRRYDWFGRRESCMMPTPEIEERFLDSATPD